MLPVYCLDVGFPMQALSLLLLLASNACYNETVAGHMLECVICSANVFKVEYNIFSDTVIQNILFQIMIVDNFRGDLTDILARNSH